MNTSKPLTILFDANSIATAGKSGVGHYASYLIQALADTFPDQLRLVGHYYDFLGRKHPTGLPTAQNISYHPTKLFPGRVPNMLRRFGISVPLELLAWRRGDLLLFPNFMTQPSLFGKPIVVTIHDLGFVEHPEYTSTLNLHDLRRYVPQSLRRAALVLTDSEFSKQAITKTYQVTGNKILVTPVPPLRMDRLPAASAKALVRELHITKSYILFVGNLEPRKNLRSLVEAYVRATDIRRTHSLVLAGGKGWKNEDLLSRISELQQQGVDIILPGYISDEQKTALYQQASLAVMPSYYEGFGMPVLEAFEYGIPVAASDIPVLWEVAEDAALYFDPYDIEEMAAVLCQAIRDTKLRKQCIAREPRILRKYSWEDTARQFMNLVSDLDT